MNLDPKLGKTDQVATVIGGFGVACYALLGGLESVWLRAIAVCLGIALGVAGICGT